MTAKAMPSHRAYLGLPSLCTSAKTGHRRPKLPKSTFLTLCRREITSFCAARIVAVEESTAASYSL